MTVGPGLVLGYFQNLHEPHSFTTSILFSKQHSSTPSHSMLLVR